jgi:polysaccharide biosynthesis protein PslF
LRGCTVKVITIASTTRRSGGTYTARRISDRIGGRIIAADQPMVRMLWLLATEPADLYHIQFEYRTFGGIGRSLVLVPLLTALLRPRGPVVVTVHGLITEESVQARKLKRVIRLAFRLAVKSTGLFASAFVVHSEGMRTIAEDEYGLHDVSVIPFGSDPVPALPTSRPKSNHVVFFGFIRPEKGIELLVEAVRALREEIPDIRLTIAGSVVYVDERGYLVALRERVRAEGLTETVRFLTKFLNDAEISALMQDAAVIVLPYTDRFVEVSLLVYDVAGYGVPLICSDIPRFTELIDGVDCLKVVPEVTELAGAIRSILLDPALSRSLSEGLLRRARQNSWDSVAARHVALYRELLEAKGVRRAEGP